MELAFAIVSFAIVFSLGGLLASIGLLVLCFISYDECT